jgi:hypothetical protein
MSILPLDIPPGVYRTGTEYEGSGRWIDANLVRWRNGSLQPIGGWVERDDTSTNPPRGMIAWEDNSGDRRYAFGTFDGLYTVSASGTLTDITPAGLTDGIEDAAVNTGYGGSFYGTDSYGTIRQDDGVYSEATSWSLDNWGEELVACSVADGVIYQWDLNTANNGVAVSNAPTGNLGIIVTDERFLFALGAGGNPKKVQWSDREDNTTWSPAATNEAGDIELQTTGRIMSALRVRGVTLILTDRDAHTATYIGPPFVYGFERVNSACGVSSRLAAVTIDSGAYWMGNRSFWTFDGGTVSEIRCEVLDYIFNDLTTAQISKVCAVDNAQFGEVWWFFPSAAGLENDKYVIYNYREDHWTIGNFGRTCGVGRGTFTNPIMADANGIFYNHETAYNYDGAEVYAETGPVSIGNGDQVMTVTSLYPDEKTQGDVQVTFKTRFYPNDVEREYGPFDPSNPTSVRFTGRQFRMRVTGDTATNWRVGRMRVKAALRGER